MDGMEETAEKKETLNVVTSVISIILHPLLMPLYATFAVFNSGTYISFVTGNGLRNFIFIVIFISTYMLPSLTAWIMLKNNWIRSLEMQTRKERTLPFIATLICYIAGTYLLFKLPVPRIFGIMTGGATLAILWCLLVNFKWKISIHMVGIGGTMGLLFGYAYYFHADMRNTLMILSILAGILAWARLIRNAHVPAQIYIGFLGGFILELYYFRMVVMVLIG